MNVLFCSHIVVGGIIFNMTVTKNEFLGHRASSNYYAGVVQTVFLEGGDSPPATSRLVVNENVFDLKPFAGEALYGIMLLGRKVTDISGILTRNDFALTSDVYTGILASEISGGHVSGNTFTGDEWDKYLVHAMMLNEQGETTATGWTVSSNHFSEFNVTFFDATAGNYFGPDQAGAIFDSSGNNVVIAEGNYPLIIDRQIHAESVTPASDKRRLTDMRTSNWIELTGRSSATARPAIKR